MKTLKHKSIKTLFLCSCVFVLFILVSLPARAARNCCVFIDDHGNNNCMENTTRRDCADMEGEFVQNCDREICRGAEPGPSTQPAAPTPAAPAGPVTGAAAPYSGALPRLLPVPGITCESLNGPDKTECKKQICPTGSSCDRGMCVFSGGDYASAQLPCNYTLDELVLVGVNFAKILFGIVGSLMLAMFVAGGYTMITSLGNPEEIQKGRKMLTGALVGGIIVLGAAGLTQFAAMLVGGNITVTDTEMRLIEMPASGGSAGSQGQGAGPTGAGTGGGTGSAGASGCTCNVSISVSALLPVNGQDICNRAIAQGALCNWAGSSCDCAGPVPGISQDDCSLERLRQRYDPGVPGVTVNGSCSWR